MRFVIIAVIFISFSMPLGVSSPRAQEASEFETGMRLATLLRAGRSVVSGHQKLINDPALGEKGISGDRVVQEAIALYIERTGEPPMTSDTDDRAQRLAEAQIAAMREVVADHQAEIDTPGVGFKGFIPAVFGRLVNERFSQKVGTEARVKVTAPPNLVRNRKARPDAWELSVIEERFLNETWTKGVAFTDLVEVEGRPAFRMLIPEYYSASCLSCHGGPAGELDVTGYPKEGGAEGELAGAISITLFR